MEKCATVLPADSINFRHLDARDFCFERNVQSLNSVDMFCLLL